MESIRKRRLFLTNWGKLPTNKKGTKELIQRGSYNGIGYSLKKKVKKKRKRKKKRRKKRKRNDEESDHKKLCPQRNWAKRNLLIDKQNENMMGHLK